MPNVEWILLGLLAGIAAGLLLPGRTLGGFIVTGLVGIAGAVIGGTLGRTIGAEGAGGTVESVVWAVSGSVIPLAVYGMWMGRGTVPGRGRL